MRRRLRRCRLRHKIRAIKTRLNNPLSFLQRKNSIRRYLANDLTFSSFAKRRSEHKSVFTTNNTPPNQKINRLNLIALILTQGLTTAALQCTVKPLFFFFRTKSQPFNKKQPPGTINQIKQSEKTIQNLSINNTLKTKHNKQTRKTISSINRKINRKNNHNKQPTQPLNQKHSKNKPSKQTQQPSRHTPRFVNIKIING